MSNTDGQLYKSVFYLFVCSIVYLFICKCLPANLIKTLNKKLETSLDMIDNHSELGCRTSPFHS